MSEEKRYLSDIPHIKERAEGGFSPDLEIYIPSSEFPLWRSYSGRSPFTEGVFLVRCATDRTRFQIWRVDDAGSIETFFDGYILPDEHGRLCFDGTDWRAAVNQQRNERNNNGCSGYPVSPL